MECVSDWQPVIDALAVILGMIGLVGFIGAFWLILAMFGGR